MLREAPWGATPSDAGPIPRILNASDVRAARGYCMMLVPRLEAYERALRAMR
jgi:hypothetical protein